LLDRIDITVTVDSLDRSAFQSGAHCVSSQELRARVIAARSAARERFAGEAFSLNADIPSDLLRSTYRPERRAMTRLLDLLDEGALSARGLHRIIRLGWSFADLSGRTSPGIDEIERGIEMKMHMAGSL
jgi:magnesium chelatase family protein